MKLLDTHIHIDFYDDFDEIINQIIMYNVDVIFMTHLPELYEKYFKQNTEIPNIKLALGYHPILINDYVFKEKIFMKYLNTTRFIGEVGLDYSITSSHILRTKQKEVFKFICKNVTEHILSIHSRQAEEDVLDILNKYKVKKAIFHWYTGNEKSIKDILDCGYYFSANPNMLHTNKGKNILRQIPLNKLLIETDGPFIKVNKEIVCPKQMLCVYKGFEDFYGVKDIYKIVFSNFKTLLSFS